MIRNPSYYHHQHRCCNLASHNLSMFHPKLNCFSKRRTNAHVLVKQIYLNAFQPATFFCMTSHELLFGSSGVQFLRSLSPKGEAKAKWSKSTPADSLRLFSYSQDSSVFVCALFFLADFRKEKKQTSKSFNGTLLCTLILCRVTICLAF